MATTVSYRPRPSRVQRVLIALTGVAVVLAVLPIIAAIISGHPEPAGSAFAQAPSGNYAVVSRTVATDAGEQDIISVVSPEASATIDIAVVPHLPGFAPSGAVSPNGRQLALIIPDSGSQARPAASLAIVDMESGQATTLASDLDALQVPVWHPDGDAIAVTRTIAPLAEGALPHATALLVSTGGHATEILATDAALGVYPVGFDAGGQLLTVHIGRDGSTLFAGANADQLLSPYITRDWSLSPDRTRLAFIETNQDSGVVYKPRVITLGGGASAMAMAAVAPGEALGTAWKPGVASEPTFGQAGGGGVSAQSMSGGGFDIPLAYSPRGDVLAVKHWDGASFDAPGKPTIEIVSDQGRQSLPGIARFYGWATR